MSNFTSLLIDYYIQHNSAYFMSVLQNGRHVITLLFGQDLCPLKDENSFVSDLQEIANSATKWNGEIQRRKEERQWAYVLI